MFESAPNVTFDKIPSSRQSPRWYKMSCKFKSNYWKYKTEQNKPVDCLTERAGRDAARLLHAVSVECLSVYSVNLFPSNILLVNSDQQKTTSGPSSRLHLVAARHHCSWFHTHAWNSHVCFSSPAESVAWTQRWVGHFVSVSEVCWRNVDETRRHMKSNLPPKLHMLMRFPAGTR